MSPFDAVRLAWESKRFRAVIFTLLAVLMGNGIAYAATSAANAPTGDVVRLALGIVAAVASITVAVVRILDKRIEGKIEKIEAYLDQKFSDLERRLTEQDEGDDS